MTSGEHARVVALEKFPEPDPGTTPLLVAEGNGLGLAYPVGGGWRMATFPRCAAFRVTAVASPRGGHEIVGSRWVDELGHSAGGPLRHFVFGFGDRTFECLVPRWNDDEASGRADEVVAGMHALLRHDDVHVLELVDEERGRTLPTWLYRADVPDGPLVVFAHGWFGHPRKFKRLFRAWADAGITVAAPAFPFTNDESPFELDFDDVVNQPRDVSFVLDEHAKEGQRIGVGGFSLGGLTALAVGFNARGSDPRVRAVLSMAGRFHDAFGDYDMTETPLLVVHGTRDASVPYANGVAVYEAARGHKQLVTLEGDHDIAQDSSPHLDEVIEATTAFWREHLA